MAQYFGDQRWVLDAGDDAEFSTALRTGLDVDGKHPLEALHPGHRRAGLVVVHRSLRSVWHDAVAVFGIGGEYPVKADEVPPRPGNQCGQASDKVQRFQHDMSRAITKRLLVTVNDPAAVVGGKAFGGDRRSGDVAAQTFKAGALVGLTNLRRSSIALHSFQGIWSPPPNTSIV